MWRVIVLIISTVVWFEVTRVLVRDWILKRGGEDAEILQKLRERARAMYKAKHRYPNSSVYRSRAAEYEKVRDECRRRGIPKWKVRAFV
jgi:hypothetical protein